MKRKVCLYMKTLCESVFFCVLIIGLCCTSSCKGKEDKSDGEQDLEKLAYTPQNNEVEVITLVRGPFKRQLLSNGKLSAKRKSSLSFATSGIIASIRVENGSFVNKGAVIAELDARTTSVALAGAKINLQKAELELYDMLVGLGYRARDTVSMTKELLESVKMQSGYTYAKNDYTRAVTDASMRYLTAPFSGKVADISQKVHEQSAGVFCTLINDTELTADFFIMSSELSMCKKGMRAKIVPFGATAADALYGTVTNINPTVNANGQVGVTATVKNNGALIDGMDVKVLIEEDIANQLVVPKSAVVVRDGMDVLFTYTEDGLSHWIYVNILAANQDSYIVEGNKDRGAQLSEGDMVIISGNLNLADKSAVVLKK